MTIFNNINNKINNKQFKENKIPKGTNEDFQKSRDIIVIPNEKINYFINDVHIFFI